MSAADPRNSSSLTPRREALKCGRKGCSAPATCAPKIHVPAKDFPAASHKSITVVIALHLCRPHGAECRAADFITDELRHAVEAAARNRRPPDFDRAFISLIPLSDPDFLAVSRVRHQAEGH